MPTVAPRLLRPVAAVVAALLALGSTALLYLLAGIPEVESFAHIRYVLGPDGFMQSSLAITLAWAAGPIAAALCGWALAVRAARRERWTGAWMGLATYAVALLLAAFVPDLTRAIDNQAPWGQSMLEGLIGAPIMALVAGAVLGPLLVSCVVAGSAWAWIVRHVAYLPTQVRKASPFDYAGMTVLILAILSLLGSLVFSLLFNMSFGFPDGMD
jgi:hypothetical protein